MLGYCSSGRGNLAGSPVLTLTPSTPATTDPYLVSQHNHTHAALMPSHKGKLVSQCFHSLQGLVTLVFCRGRDKLLCIVCMLYTS